MLDVTDEMCIELSPHSDERMSRSVVAVDGAATALSESKLGKSIAKGIFSSLGVKSKDKDDEKFEAPNAGGGGAGEVRRSDVSDFHGFRPSFSESFSNIHDVRPPQSSVDSTSAMLRKVCTRSTFVSLHSANNRCLYVTVWL